MRDHDEVARLDTRDALVSHFYATQSRVESADSGPTKSMNSYTAGGDTSHDDDFLYDPFGDWQPVDFFLMDQVVIKGDRLEPIGSFGFLTLSPYEFDFLNFGGEGGPPADSPCAAGAQHVDWGFVKQSEGYVGHGYMVYKATVAFPLTRE